MAADGGQTSDRIQTRCLRGVTLTLASGQSRVTGDRTGAGATLQRCRVAWPRDVSALDLTDHNVPICPGLGPVSIWADDQHCDDRCRGTRGSSAQCHSLVPTPLPGHAWVSTVCFNGLWSHSAPGHNKHRRVVSCLLSQGSLSHVIANRETDHHFVSITTFNISL